MFLRFCFVFYAVSEARIGDPIMAPGKQKILVISRCCFAEDGKEMYKDL